MNPRVHTGNLPVLVYISIFQHTCINNRTNLMNLQIVHCTPVMAKIFSSRVLCLFLATMLTACDRSATSTVGGAQAQALLQLAFPTLSFPHSVDLQHAGDGTDRLFVVAQAGVIFVFGTTAADPSAKVFLDIADRVTDGGELGLLGLAFHPDYSTNGYFYVDYTASNPLRSVISRFRVSATNPDSADANSELVLLEVNQPYENHNGGQIAFGPDGLLYIAFGDGGSAGDPQNNAQSTSVLLGKILRIDVNTFSGGKNYSIPTSNPFYGNTLGYREEIYAYGLRNPWRFSFDRLTGKLWTGDVGQDAWEEIDIIENGKNYGWRIMEGAHCYSPSVNCDTDGLTLPVWEYHQSPADGCSVTGGYVYRGSMVPALYGSYVYGDYCSGRIWALSYDGVSLPVNTIVIDSKFNISSFGVDKNNELYVCSYEEGKLYRFVPQPAGSPE